MLTFAEEILLFMLDDDDGTFLPIRESTVSSVLAGAVLMDLAFANRIDTDSERLSVVNPEPTGDAVLDGALASLAQSGETRSTREWVETLSAGEAASIREQALARLVERGILERRDEKFLWVFRSRRYPMIDGRAEREAKLRIMDVLLSDAIPDPRDVALICLVDACDVFGEMLSSREIRRVAPRVEQVRKMDLIGREVRESVERIERSVMLAMAQGSN